MSNEAESTEVNIDITTSNDDTGNVHSFDDLDSMTSTKSDSEIMKEAIKDAASNDEPSEPKHDEQIEAHKSNADKSDDLADDLVEEMVEEIKMLQGSRNDDAYEVPVDAMFKAKVDGEERDVSLQDLLKDFSGREKWEPAFNELAQEKKEFKVEKDQIEGYVNTFRTKLEQGSRSDALEYFAKMAGQDALEFRKSLREDIIRDYNEFMQMSPEQKEMFERTEKLDYQERQQASKQEEIDNEQTQYETQKTLSQLRDKLGVSEDRLDSYIDTLSNSYEGIVTPEVVEQYHEIETSYDTADTVLRSYDEKLLENEKVVDKVAEISQQNPDFTESDWKEVLESVFKPTPKKSTSKKLKGTKVGEEEKKASINKNASKLDTFYDFDQLPD